jgi:transcriptional regulator with XRE-family HTH domain
MNGSLKLRELRQERGWRLADLADLAGVHITVLSLAERGKRRLSADQLVRIAQALGVRVADLFGGER